MLRACINSLRRRSASTTEYPTISSEDVTSFSNLYILDPKRDSEIQTGRASWYPYYAGFSEKFATRLIASAGVKPGSIVSDPWNGSGTTTAAAAGLGHDAFGCDLNPVMVLAARARMLSKREKSSLVPIAATLITVAETNDLEEDDPLTTWFAPKAAGGLRALEHSIQRTLISEDGSMHSLFEARLQQISDLSAFYYVALFRTTRDLLSRFAASNPTWIKKPDSFRARVRAKPADIHSAFVAQVRTMAGAIDFDSVAKDSDVRISLGSSECLPLSGKSVDLVLSSPPYCTRIDYAVATQPELAVLGYRTETEFDLLRRRLIGTTTVPRVTPQRQEGWGRCCHAFLKRLETHRSKASSTYYLKSHLQYFASIYDSLGEIARTLKSDGLCVLVVQDSYYKDVHNDVPRMIVEMSANQNLKLQRHVPFRHRQTMAAVNPNVRTYRSSVDAVESVLCFSRN